MKKILFALLVIALLVPSGVVYADGCKPPSTENCPLPPGHENDRPVEEVKPPQIDRETRPPGHEGDEPAPVLEPEYLCYPFMDCWQ